MNNEFEKKPLLSVNSIEKKFGGLKAIDNASFEILKGSITALIGPNGAGKTTLFNIMTGFIRPDSGNIYLDDLDITNLLPHQLFNKGLIRTFQIPATFERMTVLDNLMVVPAEQSGENIFNALIKPREVLQQEKKNKEKAIEVLNFLEIEHLCYEYAGNLSGGQKKLLELGRTMMAKSRIVLLDEPGAGVNPTLMVKLANNIRRLNKEKGYTFCIIEHDMDLIASLCDPIIVLSHGSVLLKGTIEEVRSSESVREAYLG
tara:strand:- start:3153 stop:3929 length:777 start_codon:yes stop_codon:yes gene_type:complete